MEAADLRKKSIEELNDELVALRREQFNLRMQQATGELSHAITSIAGFVRISRVSRPS